MLRHFYMPGVQSTVLRTKEQGLVNATEVNALNAVWPMLLITATTAEIRHIHTVTL